MAVQPLSSANDRRFGEPLPHQLSNHTRAHLSSVSLWHFEHAIKMRYAVLAHVSIRYPALIGRLLTRYSPVRHWSEDRSPHHRSTWMCYARRQRSSWARIKLSKKLYIIDQFRLRNVTVNISFQSSICSITIKSCSLHYFLKNSKESFGVSLIFLFRKLSCLVVQFSMSFGDFAHLWATSVIRFCGFCCPLSEGLFIISHPLAFVKGFFKTF